MTSKTPKILLIDIETGPGKAYFWNLFDDRIPLERMIEPGRMLCAAWMWYGEKDVSFVSEWTNRRYDMLCKVANAFDESDAVVTYNGDKFDFLKLSGEYIVNDVRPPAPITSIDLYKKVKQLGFASGKLDYVSKFLQIGEKTKHAGFALWRAVDNGDAQARLKMEKYNKQDVKLLGKLYKRLRPYMHKHPHLREGKGLCPNGGSSKVIHRGWRYNRTTKVERLQCQQANCQSWYTGKRVKT